MERTTTAQPTRPPLWILIFYVGIVIAILALGLTFDDETPLLTAPRPDIRWPLGLVGWIGTFLLLKKSFSFIPKRMTRFARGIILLMMPLFVGTAVAIASERFYEFMSFRAGAVSPATMTVKVVDKDQGSGRRSDNYRATIASPFNGKEVDLVLTRDAFETIEPRSQCLVLATERAGNGAARVVGIRGLADCRPAHEPR